jgi:haloalkane dehalogenase
MTPPIDAFRSLYPFRSRWLDRGGLRCHYVDEGSGPPVVCVHGNPTWSFYFRELIGNLRGSYRVVAPDHLGCGLSDKPGDDRYSYTLASRVADLEALIGHLGLREITLVLHDWGGAIGLAAALRRPERIARLVLLNTAGFLMPAGKRLPWQLRLVRDAAWLATPLVRGLNLFARGAARMATVRGLTPQVRSAYLAPYDSWSSRIATLRFVQDIPLHPGNRSFELVRWIDENLATLRDIPTLICWGARDFVFDERVLAEWRRRLPEADVRVYESAGHYVLEDAGAEVIGEIRRFLVRTEQQAARTSFAAGAPT